MLCVYVCMYVCVWYACMCVCMYFDYFLLNISFIIHYSLHRGQSVWGPGSACLLQALLHSLPHSFPHRYGRQLERDNEGKSQDEWDFDTTLRSKVSSLCNSPKETVIIKTPFEYSQANGSWSKWVAVSVFLYSNIWCTTQYPRVPLNLM